jgi:hypothetical protein
MIITWLTGGLGNQMFQYAAGLALAEHRRTVLKLDVSWFREDPAYEAHNRYALSCLNICEQFATQEEIDRIRGVRLTRTERWSGALARALRLYRYANRYAAPANWHRPPGFRFYADFLEQPDNTYLNGMFQSEKFFAPVGGLLRCHFSLRYPPPPEVAAMAERIRHGPSAAIHFRWPGLLPPRCPASPRAQSRSRTLHILRRHRSHRPRISSTRPARICPLCRALASVGQNSPDVHVRPHRHRQQHLFLVGRMA